MPCCPCLPSGYKMPRHAPAALWPPDRNYVQCRWLWLTKGISCRVEAGPAATSPAMCSANRLAILHWAKSSNQPLAPAPRLGARLFGLRAGLQERQSRLAADFRRLRKNTNIRHKYGKLEQSQQWQLPGMPSVFPGEMGKEGKERCRRETGEASANMG